MPHKPPTQQRPGQPSRQQQRQQYDRKRDLQPWRQWYKTARWARIRAAQLARDPLCAICLKAGRVTAATVCDHVEPHRGDPEKFWNGPFQSLCDEPPWRCHSSIKQREERGS